MAVESADGSFSATVGSHEVSFSGSNACSAPCTRIHPLPRPNPSTWRRMRADRVRDRVSCTQERDGEVESAAGCHSSTGGSLQVSF